MDISAHVVPSLLRRGSGWVVAVKPPGVISEHGSPGDPGFPELLAGALSLPAASVYPVHRLDRQTGGVMVFATRRETAATLSRALQEGRMAKTYLAVCEGVPAEQAGRWQDLLFFDRRHQKAFPVERKRAGVKEAILRYECLRTEGQLSLLRLQPETGRTHQIRVQCASRGLPLAGDRKYGGRSDCGCALWACSLSFPDPEDDHPLRFQAPPPARRPWTLFPADLWNDL